MRYLHNDIFCRVGHAAAFSSDNSTQRKYFFVICDDDILWIEIVLLIKEIDECLPFLGISDDDFTFDSIGIEEVNRLSGSHHE